MRPAPTSTAPRPPPTPAQMHTGPRLVHPRLIPALTHTAPNPSPAQMYTAHRLHPLPMDTAHPRPRRAATTALRHPTMAPDHPLPPPTTTSTLLPLPPVPESFCPAWMVRSSTTTTLALPAATTTITTTRGTATRPPTRAPALIQRIDRPSASRTTAKIL